MPVGRRASHGEGVTLLVLPRRARWSPRGLGPMGSRGVLELGLVMVLYVTYSAGRLLADDAMGPAMGRGLDLHGLEAAAGLDWERTLNGWFVGSRPLGLLGSYWYAAAHYLVTAVALVWLYRRGPAEYAPARRALVLATLLALGLYLLMPMAPPRLTGGFVDVLELHSAQGWWGGDASAPRGLGGLTNQVAAMPSLHAGWALWVALVLHRQVAPPWRLLGWGHAGVTAVVVVGTGNHWVLDVLAGWLVVLVGDALVRLTSTGSVRASVVHTPNRTRWPVRPAARRVGHMATPDGVPPESSSFVARNPTDLVAVAPGVLGFHPRDSVVLLTFGPPGGAFHARVDLPVEQSEQMAVADLLADAVLANGVRRAAVLLYTDDVEVARSQSEVMVGRLLDLDVDVIEVLRVDDGHWYVVPEDGSPGTAYELSTHPCTAQRVYDGQVVHRDRAELADSLVGTDEDDAVEVAMAATRFADLVATSQEVAGSAQDFLRGEATWLQQRIRARVAAGGSVGPADAGRMLVLASLVPTRDAAWVEITREDSVAHLDLWRELVRRSPRDLLPGAASLLAFAAWQHGDGALAWCAIDRCLEVDPDYSMAHCVAEVLTRAVPPTVWQQIREDELPVFRDPSPPAGSAPQPLVIEEGRQARLETR
jgi:hypothetical protein